MVHHLLIIVFFLMFFSPTAIIIDKDGQRRRVDSSCSTGNPNNGICCEQYCFNLIKTGGGSRRHALILSFCHLSTVYKGGCSYLHEECRWARRRCCSSIGRDTSQVSRSRSLYFGAEAKVRWYLENIFFRYMRCMNVTRRILLHTGSRLSCQICAILCLFSMLFIISRSLGFNWSYPVDWGVNLIKLYF